MATGPIDETSARIDLDNQGAQANVDISSYLGSRAVLTHLTRGYKGAGFEPTECYIMMGRVNLTTGNSSSSGWDFGFLQFMRINQLGAIHAGQTSRDGSVGLAFDSPPALRTPVTLDSLADRTPWTKPRSDHFVLTATEIDAKHGDHPAFRVNGELTNRKTNKKNYLYRMYDARDFWTVFATRMPTGYWEHLAHIHWSLDVGAEVLWRNGQPVTRMQRSPGLTFDAYAKGSPTEPAIQNPLQRPIPPHAKAVFTQAQQDALLGGPPNRTDLDYWYHFIRPDFWQ
jgi:hypothetical protein